jgi:hypothetical protein
MTRMIVRMLAVGGACVAAACENLPSDLASFQGNFAYTAWDSTGHLIAEGTMLLDVNEDSTVEGQWRFTAAGDADTTIYRWHHLGSGALAGSVGVNGVWLNLDPLYADANLFLTGHAADGAVAGDWSYSTIIGSVARGTFRAVPK